MSFATLRLTDLGFLFIAGHQIAPNCQFLRNLLLRILNICSHAVTVFFLHAKHDLQGKILSKRGRGAGNQQAQVKTSASIEEVLKKNSILSCSPTCIYLCKYMHNYRKKTQKPT